MQSQQTCQPALASVADTGGKKQGKDSTFAISSWSFQRSRWASVGRVTQLAEGGRVTERSRDGLGSLLGEERGRPPSGRNDVRSSVSENGKLALCLSLGPSEKMTLGTQSKESVCGMLLSDKVGREK